MAKTVKKENSLNIFNNMKAVASQKNTIENETTENIKEPETKTIDEDNTPKKAIIEAKPEVKAIEDNVKTVKREKIETKKPLDEYMFKPRKRNGNTHSFYVEEANYRNLLELSKKHNASVSEILNRLLESYFD